MGAAPSKSANPATQVKKRRAEEDLNRGAKIGANTLSNLKYGADMEEEEVEEEEEEASSFDVMNSQQVKTAVRPHGPSLAISRTQILNCHPSSAPPCNRMRQR